MKKSINLTEGPLGPKLLRVALPLIATNFIQTAYNVVDMIWIGKLGSGAVIAIGTAGFLINMAIALSTLIVIGTGIKISQSYGAKSYDAIGAYIANGFILSLVVGLLYGFFIILFREPIIGFFNIGSPQVRAAASSYLFISMIGVVFMYCNTLFSNILNSLGNSSLSFKINTVGFLLNLILDPLFIFGLSLGVEGAAIATIISRFVVLILSFFAGKTHLKSIHIPLLFSKDRAKEVFAIGFPVTLQRVSFTFVGIAIAKIISSWGPEGIGVQKIGIQIESLSYMTMGGLYGAVIASVGQNYGAGKIYRIEKTFQIDLTFSLILGLITTSLFLIFPRPIFKIFLDDPEILNQGVTYLRILAVSQVFMCAEIGTRACFDGLGKTKISAAVSLSLTALRIPLALFFSGPLGLGLEGVWWAISLTSIFKGIILALWFKIYIKLVKNK